MKTEQQTRIEFAKYYLHMKDQCKVYGDPVPSKSSQWEMLIQCGIDEGDLPEDAVKWKCPRSLENLLK